MKNIIIFLLLITLSLSKPHFGANFFTNNKNRNNRGNGFNNNFNNNNFENLFIGEGQIKNIKKTETQEDQFKKKKKNKKHHMNNNYYQIKIQMILLFLKNLHQRNIAVNLTNYLKKK